MTIDQNANMGLTQETFEGTERKACEEEEIKNRISRFSHLKIDALPMSPCFLVAFQVAKMT